MVPPGEYSPFFAKMALVPLSYTSRSLDGATSRAHSRLCPQLETSQNGGKNSDLCLLVPHRFARSPVLLAVMLLYHLGQIMVNGKS